MSSPAVLLICRYTLQGSGRPAHAMTTSQKCAISLEFQRRNTVSGGV